MLRKFVIMLNYAPVKNESYYAQNYASIMCQALLPVECACGIRLVAGSGCMGAKR